jgi:Ca2+-binding RTX toxin-like protein
MYRLLPLAALVAAIALPSAAHGATLDEYDGIRHTLLVDGGPAETNLISVADGKHSVVITDDAGPLQIERSAPCVRLDSNSARCFMTKRVAVELNDGNDVATIATSREVWLGGGAGNDRYNAIGTGKPSRVDFFGGFGNDVANYFYATEGVNVGVDGAPFDGRPGDNDRIDRTVETVFGSPYDDKLTGTQREQRLFGFDGDDQISGGPAADELHGGPGQDRIDARDGELDTVDCGGQMLDRVTADASETSILGCAEVLMQPLG